MSYILEALKKSDQQRQRGATPTLQAAQVAVAAQKRPVFIYYSLLAAVLLGAGIMIGWLHPWQPEQTPPEPALPGTEIIAAESPTPNSQLAAPATFAAPPKMPGKTTQKISVPNAATAAPIPDKSAGLAQGQEALPLNELPRSIQQEIPAMEVQLHGYSSEPGERLVSINSIRLREGGSLMPGLRLEQITPDGMIFSYKGYRFRRGIR